jgi:putative redox protein
MASPGLVWAAGRPGLSPFTIGRPAGHSQTNLPTAEGRRGARAWQADSMTSNAGDAAHREVTIERIANGVFAAVNERGGRLTFGTGSGTDFTPTELLLAAIGGCTAIDVDILTTRRAEPESFEVRVEANKVRDADGNRLAGIAVTFLISFPDGEAGDAARAVLPDAVKKSRDRLCTVGRTVEIGTPISERVA